MTSSSFSIEQGDLIQLAIETTGRTGSIAILQGEAVLDDVALPEGSRTAAALTPALDEAIRRCRRRGLEPGLVSVAAGPGSFTGLRIGLTTAKTLCYATRWPLVAVGSLSAIAATVFARLPPEQDTAASRILVGVNAYRRQVFSGWFTRDQLLPPLASVQSPGRFEPPDEVEVLSAKAWQSLLDRLERETLLAGDAKVFGAAAAAGRFVPRGTTDAVGVGLLGLRAARAGHWADPLTLTPRYLKPSAAEEKAAR